MIRRQGGPAYSAYSVRFFWRWFQSRLLRRDDWYCNHDFVCDIDYGHAVMVQGIWDEAGVRYIVVRDPAAEAYLEPSADFDARLVRDPQVLAFPAIWGER